MRKDTMLRMTAEELDVYARVCGIDATAAKTVEEKVALIEACRTRTADVRVLGMSLAIPLKRFHDQRLTALLQRGSQLTDDEAASAMTLLFGEEQYERILECCTDDDGTVDVDAVGYAFATVITDESLKNY